MLRILGLALTLALPAQGFAQDIPADPPLILQPEDAKTLTTRLWQSLGLAGLMPVLQQEAQAEAPEMAQSLFPQGGTGNWAAQVKAIHDPARPEAAFRQGIAAGLQPDKVELISAALDFYDSDLGQRIVALEATTRQAMLSADVEEEAYAAFAIAAEKDDPRANQITRLIEEADLIGPNVAGGLNAAVAFSEGFSAGDGFDMPMTKDEMIAEAWAQEAEIEAETRAWIEGYLMLAYSSLSDYELERYIRFSVSAEGQTLAALMFDGFDRIFIETSYALGLAAAGQLQGREL